RAAGDGQAVEVGDAGVFHVGGKVKLLAIGRQLQVAHLPVAAGKLLFGTRAHMGAVEVRVPRSFALEVDGFIVYPAKAAPTPRASDAGAGNPSFVALAVQKLQAARGGVQPHDPAVLVVGGGNGDHRIRTGIIPHHTAHANLPVLRVCQQFRLGIGVVVPEVGQVAEARERSGADAVHGIALPIVEVCFADRLRVAHFGAGMDIFGIARFGNVVGHDGAGVVF